jgi:acyl-CoA synthetase (AMP-forming)/AMP-acid ligase II
MSWNFGDIFDALDAALPGDEPVLIQGDRTITRKAFAARSNNLAAELIRRGAQPGDKVAFYTRNCPEYLELLAACCKARLVHVNVNFRYRDEELWYILDNSDAKFVFFGEEFADQCEALTARLPGASGWVQIGGAPRSFAHGYEALATEGEGAPLGIERSAKDLLFIYTGGTTGMPKGVMWAAEDMWGALGGGGNAPANGGSKPESVAMHVENVRKFGRPPRQLPACPLMHGTGLLTAINTLSSGGCIVLLEGAGFDPAELFEVVAKNSVDSTVIVGDAFARPMLNALEAEPGRFELSALKVIMSSGVMWSQDVKQGLLKHHPDVLLADMFGSSEAVGFGTSVSSAKGGTKTAKFEIGPDCKVFTEDHREVEPGSGERGFIARRGPIPTGYYKDPEKSEKTFPTINGVRYSIPGDWCTVEADGTLTLLGRGSVCINTAGEKVYPEEVEEALKTHPAVEDALVVGVADEKWGQAVTGIVETSAGAEFDEQALRDHVREHLAGYKTPKRVFNVEKMFRAPNGKADYKSATQHAQDQLG